MNSKYNTKTYRYECPNCGSDGYTDRGADSNDKPFFECSKGCGAFNLNFFSVVI